MVRRRYHIGPSSIVSCFVASLDHCRSRRGMLISESFAYNDRERRPVLDVLVAIKAHRQVHKSIASRSKLLVGRGIPNLIRLAHARGSILRYPHHCIISVSFDSMVQQGT